MLNPDRGRKTLMPVAAYGHVGLAIDVHRHHRTGTTNFGVQSMKCAAARCYSSPIVNRWLGQLSHYWEVIQLLTRTRTWAAALPWDG